MSNMAPQDLISDMFFFLSNNRTVHLFLLFQVDEILDAAEKIKAIGNEQFKKQNYAAAEKKYSKTLR